MRAEVLTPWVGDGLTVETANRPELGEDYQIKIEDITGQPAGNLHPDPNLYSVLVECDEITLAAIEADPKYHVVWSE